MVNVPPAQCSQCDHNEQYFTEVKSKQITEFGSHGQIPFTLSYINQVRSVFGIIELTIAAVKTLLCSPSSGESDLMIILLVEATIHSA